MLDSDEHCMECTFKIYSDVNQWWLLSLFNIFALNSENKSHIRTRYDAVKQN